MLRRLPVILFICASLFSQASTAFACKMTGQVMLHCCCESEVASAVVAPDENAAAQESCCEQIVLPDGPAWAESAKTSTKQVGLDFDELQPAMAAVATLAPRSVDTNVPRLSRPPDSPAAPGTRTYLLTQRLRI